MKARGATRPRDGEPPIRRIAANRRAHFDFLIEEKIEAGLDLMGSEVKVLRMGHVDFQGAHARVNDGQAWLIHLKIAAYEKATVGGHDPLRPRRLLLHRREIARLDSQSSIQGRTLIPLSIYFKGPWAKVEIGICRGKTHGDKRAALRDAEHKRDMTRELRKRR